MQVKIKKQETFVPIKVELTLESEQEAKELMTLLNYTPVLDNLQLFEDLSNELENEMSEFPDDKHFYDFCTQMRTMVI